MRNINRWLIAAAGIPVATAAPAWALDLTGTWEGTIKLGGGTLRGAVTFDFSGWRPARST
jgi:hypothetical protein